MPPEHRAEAAELLRTLVDLIVVRRKPDGDLSIDLHGDLAGILTIATSKDKVLQENDLLVRELQSVGFEELTPDQQVRW